MKTNKKIIITILIALAIFGINLKVEAAYSASNQTVNSGASISITVKSTEKLESFDVACIDAGGLQYNSCSSSVTGAVVNSAGKKISYAAIGGEATTLGIYKFTAPTVTEKKTYTIKFDVNGEPVSSTVTVKPIATQTKPSTDKNETNKDVTTQETPKEKSNNAYLSTLGVRIKDKLAEELGVKADEYDFTGFSKTKTSYSVTIPKNVDYLNVVYGKSDSNATVKVTGNSGFKVGSNNKITIKVTAEDGKTTKTYTIKVTKLAEEEEKPGNLIEDMEGIYLTSLKVEGIELSPEFSKDVYSYTAELNDSSINELKVTAEANNENVNVDISGNTELVEGDNTINIVLTLEDSTDQIVYQVVVTKAIATEVITEAPEKTESSTTDLIGMIKGYVGIAIGVMLLMIVAVIVLIVLLRKENRRIREEENEDDIEEIKAEEYNVYNNDENEFENNEIEKDNFIESLYKQRNGNTYNEEELSESEKETIEEINEQTEKIFAEKVEGQSVEYTVNDLYEENPLETRRKRRRGKGKHSL